MIHPSVDFEQTSILLRKLRYEAVCYEVGMLAITKLFSMLPPINQDFPIDDRLEWLRAVEAALRIAYRPTCCISIEKGE